MLNWVSPEHSRTDRGRQKAVNSAITNGTSKIIHPTQTVFQVNNCKKKNHQLIYMPLSHFFKCRLNTQTWTKRKRDKYHKAQHPAFINNWRASTFPHSFPHPISAQLNHSKKVTSNTQSPSAGDSHITSGVCHSNDGNKLVGICDKFLSFLFF